VEERILVKFAQTSRSFDDHCHLRHSLFLLPIVS
jgi:hypothetical protein